ncbi:MAG: type II toxin-antitoxin system VapC family toxin [Acidobacteriaceae bacterium]
MPPVLFDSSVYVSAFRRGGDPSPLFRRWTGDSPLWLSSVALEELYAGAPRRDHPIIEKLEHDFDTARRILVPNFGDWTQAGKILARLAQKYGYESIGKARLTNDALLAMSAARTGMTIITANQRAFARLAEFRPFSWQSAESNRP